MAAGLRPAPQAFGYAPARPNASSLTVRGYLHHHARIRRADGTTIVTLASRLALTPLLDERLHDLSEGSLQKVGLVQALHASPRVLVLDEPFSAIDASARITLCGILAERIRGGAADVLSHHGPTPSELAVDRHWALAHGRLHESA